MKKHFTNYSYFFLLFSLLIQGSILFAGPTLKSADLIVIGRNTDGDDDFAVLALADLPENSVIFITDEGWDDAGFTFSDTDEEVFQWNIPAGGIVGGTIIRFTNQSGTTLALVNTTDHGTISRVFGTGDMNLAAGDQLFFYQTNNDTYDGTIQRLDESDNPEPGMIYAFNGDETNDLDSDGWLDSGAHTGSTSQAPDNMTIVTVSGGTGNAFGLLSVASESDNYIFIGDDTAADKATWITRIHTITNWNTSDTAPGFDLSTLGNSYPLPVELTSFTTEYYEGYIKLSWRTASEVNNYGFEIERKPETGEWFKVEFVAGHGNSNSPKQYEYIDENAPEGLLEYRLKQIDTDGSFEYYSLTVMYDNSITGITTSSLPSDFNLYQNYPNPFNPETTIKYSIPTSVISTGGRNLKDFSSQTPGNDYVNVLLKVYDMLGREVAVLVNEKQSVGIYNVQFDAGNISSGTYIYKLTAGKFEKSKKMILMK